MLAPQKTTLSIMVVGYEQYMAYKVTKQKLSWMKTTHTFLVHAQSLNHLLTMDIDTDTAGFGCNLMHLHRIFLKVGAILMQS